MARNKLFYEVKCTDIACDFHTNPRQIESYLLTDNLYCRECRSKTVFTAVEDESMSRSEGPEQTAPRAEESLASIAAYLSGITAMLEKNQRSPPAAVPTATSSSSMYLIPDYTDISDERMKRVARAIFDSMMKIIEQRMVEVARSLQSKIDRELSCTVSPGPGDMSNIATGISNEQVYFDYQQLYEAAQAGLKQSFYV